MRYNSMPANEFFFVVEGGPGTLGDFIWVQSKNPVCQSVLQLIFMYFLQVIFWRMLIISKYISKLS